MGFKLKILYISQPERDKYTLGRIGMVRLNRPDTSKIYTCKRCMPVKGTRL